MAASSKRAKAAISAPAPVVTVVLTQDANDSTADGLILVSPFQGGIFPCSGVAGNRLILAPTGALTHDTDDVRAFADAAAAGVKRAVAAGCKQPVLYVCTVCIKYQKELFAKAVQVAVLGALAATYVPVEVREDADAPASATASLSKLSVYQTAGVTQDMVDQAVAMEAGRAIARDICGGDPERMAPARVAEYCIESFKGTNIEVQVEEGPFTDIYPLMAAVARCSEQVERHTPRVINLSYTGTGTITKTLFFVGKGITYDTGGADVKAGGHMAGMHRDKGGAAAIAGFMRTLSLLQPAGLKVVAKLAMVRNSIGADAYVADEIIRSRAGVRTRVGNTDAEGRMAMADVLCAVKEQALTAINPSLFTIATLTGHAVRAYGSGYSAVMDNGPARLANQSANIAQAGLEWGDPCEISTVRREDYAFIQSKYITEDILQCNNEPSSATARGHQFPAAFMAVTSGIDKCGIASKTPLPYTHMDIAGSTKMWPTPVSGAPIPALTACFVL